MIDYKFAKQLKEAGFPKAEVVFQIDKIKEVAYGIPTLPELIEACGDRLRQLSRQGKNIWIIDWQDEESKYFSYFESKTPEEAVAKLWLKLNK